MKALIKKQVAALLGIGVLALSLSPGLVAKNTDPGTEENKEYKISQKEINDLLEIYKPEVIEPNTVINIKIYDQFDQLMYSDKVAVNQVPGDIRLNALLDKSDFLMDLDNTKIYKLK